MNAVPIDLRRARRLNATNRAKRQRAQHERRKPSMVARSPVTLQASWDAAENSAELNELFARAGFESGLDALDPEQRRRLIDRSRYEIHQANQWLKGAVRSAITWVFGRGPLLEAKLEDDTAAAKTIEKQFNAWFKRVKGPRKLRAMGYAKITDGSGLGLIISNDRLKGPVKLDFVPFEDEHIRAPLGQKPRPGQTWETNYLLDGKELDAARNPVRYWITPNHPADDPTTQPEPVDAEFVLDCWAFERPSQARGYPEMGTSIGSGPMMRIYEKAVLDAAATAAKHTVLVETNIGTMVNGESLYQPVDTAVEMPISYGMQTYMPAGHKASQMKAEQPTTSHKEFIRTNVTGAGRPLGQPSQVSTGDAAGMNFAGGQLGRQDYEADVDIQRQDWETEVMDKLFIHWAREAALANLIPRRYADADEITHEWRWTRRRHQDTNREYSGRRTAMESGLTSPAFWQEDDGVDPEAEDEASARSYGVTVDEFRRARFLQLYGEAGAAALGLPPLNRESADDEPSTNEQPEPDDDDEPHEETSGDDTPGEL